MAGALPPLHASKTVTANRIKKTLETSFTVGTYRSAPADLRLSDGRPRATPSAGTPRRPRAEGDEEGSQAPTAYPGLGGTSLA
jgi:hypothetical protein